MGRAGRMALARARARATPGAGDGLRDDTDDRAGAGAGAGAMAMSGGRGGAWARSVAEVDLAAIASNVAAVKARVGRAEVCAVVKADGYGHGAVPVARAALAGGATWLAVAHAAEGLALRHAGIGAPVLLLSEPFDAELADVVEAQLQVTVYTPTGIARLARTGAHHEVHLKIDTGMHRVGADPGDAVALARAIVAEPNLRLAALWTHCAAADEPANPFTGHQLRCFAETEARLAEAGIEVGMRHAANSAAALAHPASHLDLVRLGIAMYGVPPAGELAGAVELRPALRWTSEVAYVKRVRRGERISYGLRHTFARDSLVATVPVGYADGVPRRWGLVGGRVLIGGRARPIVGVVTMDQLMVDCGPADVVEDGAAEEAGLGQGAADGARGVSSPGAAMRAVSVGDEVVLLGRQGDAEIDAADIAGALDTIPYEVLTSIGPRVRRVYRNDA